MTVTIRRSFSDWPDLFDSGIEVNHSGGHPDRYPSRPSQGIPEEARVRAFLMLTAGGPLVILTSYQSVREPDMLRKLKAKGITKFVAYPIPLDLARDRYGAHFFVVERDLDETEDMRVLDYNGERAFSLFRFDELGPPETYEATAD